MKRAIASFLSALGIAVAAEPIAWPPLPKDGFVIGRAATKSDVAAGHAVFVAAQGEITIGKPIAIQLPQYAWYKGDKRKAPAVVIQAEEANGKRIVGARLLDGRYVAGFITDFELLGTEAPK